MFYFFKHVTCIKLINYTKQVTMIKTNKLGVLGNGNSFFLESFLNTLHFIFCFQAASSL